MHSDSLVAVGILRGDMVSNAEHNILASQCKNLIASPDWTVKISHCYRESNKAADTLANIGVRLDVNLRLFSNPPSEIMTILYADNVGATWPRLINA